MGFDGEGPLTAEPLVVAPFAATDGVGVGVAFDADDPGAVAFADGSGDAVQGGFGGGRGSSVFAFCVSSEVPKCGTRVLLAVYFSGSALESRSSEW